MLNRGPNDKAHKLRPPPRAEIGYVWDMELLELVPSEGASEHARHAHHLPFEEEFPKQEIAAAIKSSLDTQDVSVLLEASSLLREATFAGSAEDCRQIIGLGAVRAFSALLEREDAALQEDAVMSLLNLANHKELSSILEQGGIVVPLCKALQVAKSPSVKSNIAALLKVVIQREVQSYCLISGGAVDNLVAMLKVPQRTPPCGMPRSTSRSVTWMDPSKSKKILFSPTVSSAGDDSVHNACMALMHLAHFKTVRAALIKAKVVPLLVDLAPIRDIVDAEQSICALFQLLARGRGGPEAICLEDGGKAADTLLELALNGGDVSQEMAVDALLAAASAENTECGRTLTAKSIPQKLASSSAFLHSTSEARTRVMHLCTACAAAGRA